MGEIADAMLNGDLCEMCGVAIDGDDIGIPMYCSEECAMDRGLEKKDAKHRIAPEL